MKALISRASHRPEQRYSGVYTIQGAMITDADLDERSAVTIDADCALGDDTISSGVPAKGGAVSIGNDLVPLLHEGTIYADGLRGELRSTSISAFTNPLDIFTQQKDLPVGPELPTGKNIIYADIWDRPVFPLEDAYLSDIGLHGANTGFRTRRMVKVKAAPLEFREDIEDGAKAFPRKGTGHMTVKEISLTIDANNCDPCAEITTIDQMVPNALWRLEIVAVEGPADNFMRIAIAWSEENAAEIAPAGVSSERFERANKVYEFYSVATECHNGVFANFSDAKLSAFTDDLDSTPNPAIAPEGSAWPFVRRWDGFAEVSGSIGRQLGKGYKISQTGRTVSLQVETHEITLELAGASVVRGDFWLVELRRNAPQGQRARLVQATPVGIEHHFCTLFEADGDKPLPLTDRDRRKLSFPVLADLPADHVGFVNTCEKLYGTAENVQQALSNLCAISADDIAFISNCDNLYNNSKNVQEALDSLCKTDFSVRESFRLMSDWGVHCGLVPSKTETHGGKISITAGSYMNRSGQITKSDRIDIDLSSLKIGESIKFASMELFRQALLKEEVCLALAVAGVKTQVFLVPKSEAFGPVDRGFAEKVRLCMAINKPFDFGGWVETLQPDVKTVAQKMVLGMSGDGAFKGAAKMSKAEFKLAEKVNAQVVEEFRKVANIEEVANLEIKIKDAKGKIPLVGHVGVALDVQHMLQATSVMEIFLESEEERRRRCICAALFPDCPPQLGEPPFYVPIACLKGNFDPPTIFITKVCATCCRKQAMTWRTMQYYFGDMRARLEAQYSEMCCIEAKSTVKPVKPTWALGAEVMDNFDFVTFVKHFELDKHVLAKPPGLPTDFMTKVEVRNLSVVQAQEVLKFTGIDVADVIDANDAAAFEKIQAKMTGLSAAQVLMSKDQVRPGDTVSLVVQDGKALGYVLTELGSGKLPFEPLKLKVVAAPLSSGTLDTSKFQVELQELLTLRKDAQAGIAVIKDDLALLQKQRIEAVTELKVAQTQLKEFSFSREKLAEQVKAMNEELVAVDKQRLTIMEKTRLGLPTTVVMTDVKPEITARLASEGIITLQDISNISNAKAIELENKGIIKRTEMQKFSMLATDFIKR